MEDKRFNGSLSSICLQPAASWGRGGRHAAVTAQHTGWSSLVLYLQQAHSLAPQSPTCLGESQISARQFSIFSFKWISLYPCPHPHLQAPKEVPGFPALVLNDTMSRCHCHLLRGAES